MAFNLKPPDITLDFERRKYRLGDTITTTVTLIPNGNTRVRKASLNLVALVRRVKVKMGRTMGFTLGLEDGASTIREEVPQRTNDYLPMQQHTEQKITTEVCYSAQFLTSESLRRDAVSRRKADLEIGPHLPKVALEVKELERDANSSISIERWWLEVQVDVAMGRDQSVRKVIDVILT